MENLSSLSKSKAMQIMNKSWAQQLLYYRPMLLGQLQELLATVTAYLPRQLAQRLLETPTTKAFTLTVEGTAMFADIDGFTAMTERFSQAASQEGAEEVTELVNRFLAILISTTRNYGGDLQKFGGDSGLLLFTGEEHAMRAVAAALEVQRTMREQMGEVDTSLGRFPFGAAIGLGNGSLIGAAIGDETGREWLLAGDPLQTMSQAQGIAPGGGVVLDQSTYLSCEDAIEVESLQSGFYITKALKKSSPQEKAPSIPVPPEIDEVSRLDWLLTRLNALGPYLAEDLLERLTMSTGQLRLWSEHRHATILMLALNNLPDLESEKLPSPLEESSRFFVQARDTIKRYDGIVNKIGIGPQGAYLMALFGAPKAHEDDPLRAILAALEIQEVLSMPLRIGVNTGFVFAGDVGTTERREYTVIGDAVNLAYRLMSSCQAGEVWLGPDTAKHPTVSRRVASSEGPPQSLKGKRDLIVPHIAHGLRRQSYTGTEATNLPLLGRKPELQHLETALAHIQEHTNQTILLCGEAGIGKSRLAHEALIIARKMGFRVHRGAAPSYGAHLPYGAWERPMLSLLKLDTVPASKRPQVLLETLERYHLKEWAALLAPLLGIDISPSPEVTALPAPLREKQRQATLRDLWIQSANEQPQLLVLENVQWMPSTSLDLLDSLIAAPPEAPLLVLITSRDEKNFTERWKEQTKLLKISLGPLSRRETIAMARQIAHAAALPSEVEHWIVKHGGGIPLFTAEAVRTLMATGVLERQNERWQLTQSLDEAPLPDTTYEMIQSRIDQLEPPSRHLLRAATVVGEQMTVPMLVAGYGEEPRTLVERRLPTLSPLGLVPGDVQGEIFIFRQPLVREVAYRGLPYRIRRLIHQRIAEYLKYYRDQATSNWLTLLAHHAFEAQAWEVAIQANLDLGRRALNNYLTTQASQALRRVLEAANSSQTRVPETRYEAHHLLAETLTITGKYEEALDHIEKARRWLTSPPQTAEDIARMAHLEYHTAAIFKVQGNYEAAFRVVEQGLALPHIEETIEGAQLYLMGAGLFHRQGKYKEEETWASRSALLAKALVGDEALKVLAQDLYLLAYLASRQGNPSQALEMGEQSLEIYHQLQDLLGEMDARNNLLLIHLGLGQWKEAVKHGERALAIAQRIKHIEGQAKVAANLGEVYRYQGRYKEAHKSYAMALGITKTLGLSYGEAVMENNLAAIALREQNWREAEEHLNRSETLFQEIGAEEVLPELYRHRAELYIGLQEPIQSLEWGQRSLQQAEVQGARQEAGYTQRILAEIYLTQGESEKAGKALEKATEVAAGIQDRYGTAQILVTQARLYQERSLPDQARATLQKAIKNFEVLGAAGDLKQYRKLLEKWEKEATG